MTACPALKGKPKIRLGLFARASFLSVCIMKNGETSGQIGKAMKK